MKKDYLNINEMVFFIFILSFDVFEGRPKKRHLHLFSGMPLLFEKRESLLVLSFFSIKHNHHYSLNVNNLFCFSFRSTVNNKQWRIGMENHLTSDTWIK